MCFITPTLVPWYFWGETLWNSYFLSSILRYTVSLNVSWLVNSAAHMYGNRPYDRTISPRENRFVAIGAIGELKPKIKSHVMTLSLSALEGVYDFPLWESTQKVHCEVRRALHNFHSPLHIHTFHSVPPDTQ